MELNPETTAVLAVIPTALLAAAHLLANRLRRSFGVSEPVAVSVAGGISVAYVFLHLLPEVALGGEPVSATLADLSAPTPLQELALFMVALVGFTVFYGLERLAERGGPGDRQEGGPTTAAFAVHVGAFALYNGAVTYTLGSRLGSHVLGAVLYTVAVGVHVLVVDRGLAEHYPRRFDRVGRFVLAGALFVGWIVSVVAAPTSAFVVAVLTALVAGTVLLTVFKEELPSARRSRFGWFLAGLVGYSALLIMLTVVSGGSHLAG